MLDDREAKPGAAELARTRVSTRVDRSVSRGRCSRGDALALIGDGDAHLGTPAEAAAPAETAGTVISLCGGRI